jgi:hypothetical protein
MTERDGQVQHQQHQPEPAIGVNVGGLQGNAEARHQRWGGVLSQWGVIRDRLIVGCILASQTRRACTAAAAERRLREKVFHSF